jgi:hypothetical protein
VATPGEVRIGCHNCGTRWITSAYGVSEQDDLTLAKCPQCSVIGGLFIAKIGKLIPYELWDAIRTDKKIMTTDEWLDLWEEIKKLPERRAKREKRIRKR